MEKSHNQVICNFFLDCKYKEKKDRCGHDLPHGDGSFTCKTVPCNDKEPNTVCHNIDNDFMDICARKTGLTKKQILSKIVLTKLMK